MSKTGLIIDDRYMLCPRCETEHDILSLITLGEIDKYAHDTCPIYKCPKCKWVFAPLFDGLHVRG